MSEKKYFLTEFILHSLPIDHGTTLKDNFIINILNYQKYKTVSTEIPYKLPEKIFQCKNCLKIFSYKNGLCKGVVICGCDGRFFLEN